MTRITFTVTIDLDDAIVADLAARRHKPTPAALDTLIADCELRLSDAPRHLEGVHAVRVVLIDPALAAGSAP